MSVKANVSKDEKYPFYSVRFREDLQEWQDADEFEPNAELTEDEVTDFRRVAAEWQRWQDRLAAVHEAQQLESMRRRAVLAAVAQAGGLYLAVLREDGTQSLAVPDISADGRTWTYSAPDGVTAVGGAAVSAGDTVLGKIEMPDGNLLWPPAPDKVLRAEGET